MFFIGNCIEKYEKPNPIFKCNFDKFKKKPKAHKSITPSNKNNIFKSLMEKLNSKNLTYL